MAGLDAELVRGGQEDLGVGLAVGEIASGDAGVASRKAGTASSTAFAKSTRTDQPGQ